MMNIKHDCAVSFKNVKSHRKAMWRNVMCLAVIRISLIMM